MAAASSNNSNGTGTGTITTASTTNSNNIHIETDEFIKKSRVTRAAPPKPAYDPLQFVQIKPAKLYDPSKAKPSTERKAQVEVKAHREVEDAEEWQCNLDNWKSSRRKRVEHIIDKITEAKKIEQEEVCRGRKKSKTFSEMLENSGSKRRFILPENEDDDEGGSFSDDLHDSRDSSKQQYKDESTDDRATDDTSSCCSSKLADGELKTPDPDDTREAPEMNEFSLAIENYKSKFPMTQHRVVSGNSIVTTTSTSITTTNTSVVSSIESNSYDHYESNSSDAHEQPMECITQKLSSLEVTEKRAGENPGSLLVSIEPMESRMSVGIDREQQQQQQEQSQEESPKVNVIERRRLFEQFQQMQALGAADTKPSCAAPTLTAGGQQERSMEDNSSSSNEEPGGGGSATSSSEWFAAGSIRERRAIFERYQSNEMIAEEHDQQQLLHVGGRSRSSSNTVVVKSRSESNVGFINGSTGRFELALNQLKRNGGADYCEDSGIQSTTDLSRSSMVSQADENDPPSLLLLLPDDGAAKSPARSATLDSASEFSDTDCSNGQLLDNALDVAFEEMDSELNESGTVEDHAVPEEQELAAAHPEAEIVPLAVVPLATNNDEPLNDEQLVLMALPKSALTPPKEKPPPPPVDDDAELEIQTLSAGSVITSWMQKDAVPAPVAITLQTNGNTPHSAMMTAEHEQNMSHAFDNGHRQQQELLGDVEQWRSLESYEVVQQVQHQQQQLKQLEQEKEQERDKDQQEMLVYSNRIETLPPHHHPLYDPGEHEEIVSVERELLQIEQEELQRRREKQLFYEKLTKADTAQQQPQHLIPVQQQSQHRQPQQQQQQQQPQQPYYYSHHLPHQTHHHNLHHLHHRASMPAIDSRSLQNVNSYASYETPFLDDANTGYEMGSLHRESMPNLSHVAASSSHPSSLSSYGEEYSANSAISFDGTCWPPAIDHRHAQGHAFLDKRPAVAPRPTMNGVPDRTSLPPGVPRYHGGQQRMSNNMFEQHPKDSKQITQQQAMLSRGQGANNTTPYGQHWLVQEAEQRRIEQHQKSNNNNNNAKRPLPKFVIDAITQRVQKLNAGSPENSDRSNLSEDSDLAMINSMKHHHHHQSQSMVPPPSHHHPHHHQQPLPPPIPPQQQQQQQQKYSNTSDKVLSVSGKKECSHCRIELGKGAAMAIESLGLFYHIECFKCCVCHVKLGDGTNGIDVRVRKYRLHCQNCFSSEDGVKFSCV
ncbi:uncharacterized protein CG43427 [Anopheles stephensi]|uniref:uncharacterized protein CG43427 n=1 Tax=Anopheles stephensi TaxID=30069 RepID=UPI001658BE6E|nr:uncharacterized protein CG43427 [Anopheles stephensi]XP_035896432.1 uncharacterized protein CG43427 [Anopheles stephensi]XP_035896433.1 uncharacterized protein CG43427 [Anopheles stephensi]XP_035896434.1 uncharacterized protein CG43427 [Anopheles stephensi]